MSSRRFASPLSRALFGLTALAGCVVLLTSCGGGGGSSGGSPFDIGLPSAASLAQQCAAPRPGDTQGTLATEKAFLRSWIDETYLWYQDVRVLPAATLDPTMYTTPINYFKALKTPLLTPSGKAKDQFHFTYDTPTWIALSTAGVSYGYGFGVALVVAKAPNRIAMVGFLEPGTTPASTNLITRGAAILTVDGVDVANGTDVATLNEGLFPTVAKAHTFVILDQGATTSRTVTLTAQQITETPVQFVKTLPAPNANVGYMLFNDHIGTAESELVAAINQLKSAGVTDLVLDLRYNGGGYLDIAAELAYMIAGPTNTSGKFFERLAFNNRNPFPAVTTDFLSTAQGFSVASGTTLPYLGLDRVYVLTSPDTCSASEAIVNGLRGAGIAVNLIGGQTCGKPYGFYPRDNCNTTYFAIQFQGVNNIGFGDYPDGFTPTCLVADDFTHALGDPAENQLEVALALRNNNGAACITPTSMGAHALSVSRGPADAPIGPSLARTPLRENRIYRPQ